MAWNEPNDDDRKNDPWGSNSGKKDQGPPDLEAALNDLLRKFSGIFGGKSGGGGGGSNNNSGNNFSSGMLSIILVIAGVIWLGAGVYTVDEQERGVVLRLGRALEGVVMPGLHWNPPLIDAVVPINVTRIYDQSFTNTMLTEDDNIVDITMTVQYRITDARKYYLEVEEPEVSLQQAAESAIRHVVGGSEMDTVITNGREVLAFDAQERLQTYLDSYGTGMTISQVNIAQSRPPEQVRAAFDDVIKAREDNQSLQNEARAYANQVIPQARGNARRQIEDANAHREQVVAEAQGEAERFEALMVEYQKAPAVTRERLYIDAMVSVMTNSSKILIDVEGGNNMMYLPLDQLLQQNSRRPAPNISNFSMQGDGLGGINSIPGSARQAPTRGVTR